MDLMFLTLSANNVPLYQSNPCNSYKIYPKPNYLFHVGCSTTAVPRFLNYTG